MIFLLCNMEQTGVFHFFVRIHEQSLIDSAVITGKLHQLFVIIMDIQLLCQHLADGSSSASILSCNGNNYIIHSNHHTFLSLLLPPAATYIKGYSPRYAFLMESLLRRSLALPSRTILPVSNTYALSAIDSAFFAFCSTNRTVVPLLLTS